MATFPPPSSRRVCQICGDDLGVVASGDPFVACLHCGFPVCRPCYEYERKDGNQACPHCKQRYARHRGSPRVPGDDEDDDVEDIENDYNMDYESHEKQHVAEAMLHGHARYGRRDSHEMPRNVQISEPQTPLYTSGPQVPIDTHAMSPDNSVLSAATSINGSKRIYPFPYSDIGTPGLSKSMDFSKEFGYGSVAWKERLDNWKTRHEKLQMTATEGAFGTTGSNKGGGSVDEIDPDGADLPMMDEARQPLSRKVNIASSLINPYRLVIVLRLIILGFFFRYRILNPVVNAYGLWLTSIVCEIWFAFSWILDQFPKWFPINRETYLDRLSLRYEREGEPSQLAAVDVFVSTVDPMKEPPLVTANTVLSILAVDYPVDKVSCYVSDDGAAMLTFEAMAETSEFARKTRCSPHL